MMKRQYKDVRERTEKRKVKRRIYQGKNKVNEEDTGEMIKGGDDRVVDWIWRLCNMTFESFVPEDWKFAVIVPLYKGKVKEIGLNVRTIEALDC